MEYRNPFDAAIAEALERNEKHEAALALASELTHQLAEAVEKRTNGAVKVELVTEAHAQTLGESLLNNFGLKRRPEIGKDHEDRQVRQYLIASTVSANRALWGLTFHDEGYPVTFRGPEESASTTCFSDEDLAAAFIDAASHVRVGRKIASLIQSAGASNAQPLLDSPVSSVPSDDGEEPTHDADPPNRD